MKLTLEGIKDTAAFQKAGILLPGYDVAAVSEKAKQAPRWAHFGIGNIFRIFIGGIADGLLEAGVLDRGLTCIETFDYDVVDKIYTPYDNLGLSVILHADGTRTYKVLGSMAEAVKAQSSDPAHWARLKEVFRSKDLQLVSFTITEKGYALAGSDGIYFPFIQSDIDNGPEKATSAMAVLTAMLYVRYQDSRTPIALVSMDNCSHNGDLLRHSVLTMADEWQKKGYVTEDFLTWLGDETQVSFPWTMIDKITPRPSDAIAADLEALGVEDMAPVITSKRTYIAPFINAEQPQYLVIEDRFPNGRPELEKGFGVYLADRATVNLSERMKVTACLNPVHSATGPVGVVLGEELYAKMLNTDPDMMKMARMVAYDEGLPMVEDPKILSPKAFTDELFTDRFPNEYLGDTNLRLATDTSQGVGVRFGETIKAYVKKYGSAERLTAIPLGIAGWLRYMLGIDDMGNTYELAPDPMVPEIQAALSSVVFGDPSSLTDQLHPILSNEKVFFIDLYKAGLGEKIEGMFREMIAGKGSTKATIHKYMM
ncbi:MAG: mannitol dehydrogenase family protein [Lachnospiraceae bacterium]|nr:mannitol dehydrogenase family protein [Lachnospiraceae bacterium]